MTKQDWREKWNTNQSKQRKTAEAYKKLKVWEEKHNTTFDFFYSLHLQELSKIREMIVRRIDDSDSKELLNDPLLAITDER